MSYGALGILEVVNKKYEKARLTAGPFAFNRSSSTTTDALPAFHSAPARREPHEVPKETNMSASHPSCHHLHSTGNRCGSPALRGEQFCFYHHPTRRPPCAAGRKPRLPSFH